MAKKYWVLRPLWSGGWVSCPGISIVGFAIHRCCRFSNRTFILLLATLSAWSESSEVVSSKIVAK
jgi:hypothetical protein